MISREEIAGYFKKLQLQICAAIEQEDGGAAFQSDVWDRPGGGGGITRVLQNGNVIEKGGVNFSAVHGEMNAAVNENLGTKADAFFATGVSIVMHPSNPFVPIIHMNVRYFEMDNGQWWFGGGIDLTPHYINEDEAKWFHQQLKEVCDRHDENHYPRFRDWAETYFYNRHRKQPRGIGGIFFDRLTAGDEGSKGTLFQFVKEVGETFAPVYTHLMHLNKNKPYNDANKQWQLVRRGHYVEFNLVYDRGTKFGLETDGRVESILMSLPLQAGWPYNFQPIAGSDEAKTKEWLQSNHRWL